MIRTALALVLAASPAACAPSNQPTSVTSPGPLATGEHEAQLRGVRLWYRVAGRSDGRPPVVFLAGGPGGNSYEFAKLAGPALERRNRMVYFDQRGTGRSERPAGGDYALATLVDDIEALRVHLRVPRLALAAHSFGGILALEYAAKYPGRVAGVVLAGPAWNAPLSCRERLEHLQRAAPDAHARLRAAGEPADADVCDAIFRAVGSGWERYNSASMFPRPGSEERQRAAVAESGLRNTGELSRALFRAGLLQYRFAGLSRVKAPVLVIAGDNDFAIGPRSQEALVKALPRARLLVYPNAGHWMFIDEPERFAKDVTDFLARGR